jgi:hypothetical protein
MQFHFTEVAFQKRIFAMAGRIIHNLGPKAQGNAGKIPPKEGENEFQRLKKEGWKPEFLALDARDPRLKQMERFSAQRIFLGKAFDPVTGVRIDSNQILVWAKGPNNYRLLKEGGWKPRFLTQETDPWIKQERRLKIQQIQITEAFRPETGARINDPRVLVWTK